MPEHKEEHATGRIDNPDVRTFLYEFTRKEVENEDARWEAADKKATNFTPILGLLLGAAGFFGNWVLQQKMVPPESVLDWLAVLFVVCAFISIFLAWLFVFNAFKVRRFGTSSLRGDGLVEFILKRDLSVTLTGYAYRFARVAKKNKGIVDEKLSWLIRSYYAIFATVILLISLLLVVGIHAWLNPIWV
jgi:hypothetical protein